LIIGRSFPREVVAMMLKPSIMEVSQERNVWRIFVFLLVLSHIAKKSVK
jgi:hypothetical protein